MSVLVVGEALVDLINRDGGWTFHANPGGSPMNVSVGLAAAAVPVRFAGEYGDDLFGGLIAEYLERYAVGTADVVRSGGPTSLAFALVGADGVARYDFRFGWAFPGDVSLDGVTCLHTGSLATVVEPGAARVRALIERARAAGVVVSYDPNVRPALIGPRESAVAGVEGLVARADIVKVSDEDLRWLYPGAAPAEVAGGWADRGPRLVVVTRGGEGALALHDGVRLAGNAPPVTVADTVGAGDMFMAGLLGGLHAGGALGVPAEWTTDLVERALRTATATAAAVCAHRGAAPPDASLVARLLDEVVVTRTHRPAAGVM